MKKLLRLIPVTICMLLLTSSAYAQKMKVTGHVKDAETGSPLPGVDILVEGTTIGTTTGANGGFTINVKSSTDTLRFSYIGYTSKDVPVRGRNEIDVKLQPKVFKSNQLVVVGYGTQKRSDLTGAISSVSSKSLQQETISTPDQALQGKVSGVMVHTNSHAPGGSISVQIRGTSSISANGQPLYVIDGMPISKDYYTGSAGGPTSNPLNSIDPSDIASIQVLKGPSAAAIYGSRAVNGVVLITTKEGQRGAQHIDFETSMGIQHISKTLKLMNAQQWANQLNEAAAQFGEGKAFTSQQISAMGNGTNWQQQLYRTAPTDKYKLSFSGGTNNLQYLVSGVYLNQEGIVRGTSFKRYSSVVNLHANVNKNLTVGDNLMFTASTNDITNSGAKGYGTQPDIIKEALIAPPNVAPYDTAGNPTLYNTYPLGLAGPKNELENPLEMANNYKQQGNTIRLVGSVHADWTILPNLDFRTRLGSDIRDFRWHTYYPIGSLAAGGSNGRASESSDRTINILNEETLTYQKSINANNHIKVLAGFSYQQEKTTSLAAASYDFPSNFYLWNNLSLGGTPQTPGSGASKWSLISYFGRVNYSLFDKYLLTASLREDGSSKFGKNNKYGIFPSVALAWRLGQENFIKNLGIFSHLKARASYGVTGNSGIGVYNSLSRINTATQYVLNGKRVPDAYPANVANPDLSWEKTREIDGGINAGFFNDRLSVTADYYYKKTTALLLNVPLPSQTGFGSVLENIGAMRNKGFEFALNSQNLTGPLNWTTNFNISFNRNKILSLGGAPYLYTGWVGDGNVIPHGRHVVRLQPGHPVGEFYGSVFDGVWHSQSEINKVGTMPAAKPGDIRFKDTNGDGVYNTNDDQFLGNPNPKFSFGFTNNFDYKHWSLNIFMYGEYGNKILNLTKERLIEQGTGLGIARLNRWTPQNTSSNIPGAASINPIRVSSNMIEDGSYLKVGNIGLTYNIPVHQWKLSALHKASIALNISNVLTITKYSGYDPEVNTFGDSNTTKGVDRYGYPSARTYRLDIKFGF